MDNLDHTNIIQAFYALGFDKCEGVYCFWLVRPSVHLFVRPLQKLRYSFEILYIDFSLKKIFTGTFLSKLSPFVELCFLKRNTM